VKDFFGTPICTMRPASMTAMRSASVKASSRSCVTYTAVMPIRCCSARTLPQFEAHLVIEVRHRLIEQQQVRIDRKRGRGRRCRWPPEAESGTRPETLELQQLGISATRAAIASFFQLRMRNP
jgi:hypothetical protein